MANTIAPFGAVVLCCACLITRAQYGTINMDPMPINGSGMLVFDTITHTLYGGAPFDYWNGAELNRIWQWHDGEFDSVGGGLIQTTNRGLQMHEGDLYLGGTFEGWTAGYDIHHLARWDGTSWHPSGEPNAMTYLFKTGEELWCTGYFDSIGGQPVANNLARLVGNEWESFGTTLFSGSGLITGALYQGSYYFGGNTFPPFIDEDVVRWDGSSWVSVGGGIAGAADAWVNAMVVYHDKLYVGGYFWDPGNLSRNIKVWNGSSWEGFFPAEVTCIGGQVDDLEVIDDKLYLTGRWQFAGDDSSYAVLIYDGEHLCGLGRAPLGNVPGRAYNIAGNADSIFFGTNAYILSGDTVNYYAVWPVANGPDTCVTIPLSMREPPRTEQLRVYPNPASEEVTLDRSTNLNGPSHVRIFDMLGRCVLDEQRTRWLNGKIKLDVNALLPGVYVGAINAWPDGRFSFMKQ